MGKRGILSNYFRPINQSFGGKFTTQHTRMGNTNGWFWPTNLSKMLIAERKVPNLYKSLKICYYLTGPQGWCSYQGSGSRSCVIPWLSSESRDCHLFLWKFTNKRQLHSIKMSVIEKQTEQTFFNTYNFSFTIYSRKTGEQ